MTDPTDNTTAITTAITITTTTSTPSTAPTATPRTETNQDNPRDDEGLLLQYDVVLCGTGLVQSILASALARAGKTVLHCDASDYYGELDAVWTFPYLEQLSVEGLVVASRATVNTNDDNVKDDALLNTGIHLSSKGAFDSLQIHSRKSTTTFSIQTGTQVSTPYGTGTYEGIHQEPQENETYTSLAISLTNWKLANGSCPTVYVGVPPSVLDSDNDSSQLQLATYLKEKHNIQAGTSVRASQVLYEHSRSIALDVTPSLLFCAGLAVQSLLISGVADYLEFKSLEGLLWLEQQQSSKAQSNTSKDGGRLERVPCSKNDVFSTTLLSPMDKRRLMKFMQLAADYAVAEGAQEESDAVTAAAVAGGSGKEEDVRSLNERHLNQGRSLARPQNKVVSTDDILLLRQCIAESMDFETYLTEKQRLSPHLRSLVRYALALESGLVPNSSNSDSNSDDDDSSSPISTLVGMKNLCQHMQSLGRFGSTAFLVPVYGSGELPQAFCRSAAVYGATYLLRRAPLRILTSSTVSVTSEQDQSSQSRTAVQGIILGGDEEDDLSGKPVPKRKQVNCSHVIAPLESMRNMRPSNRRVLRQISIMCGKPITDSADQQQPQRHAVILPPNSVGNSDSIHGLILDEKVNVVPHVTGGCTVIHLTTTVDVVEGADVDNDGILQKALDSIVGKQSDGDPDVYEIYRVVFSYSLFDTDQAPALAAANVNGLHTIHRPRPGLAADPAFEQAKQIFTRICPTVAFLTMSEAMDAAVKETLGDRHNEEEDDEKMVLESAMGMMDTPSEE